MPRRKRPSVPTLAPTRRYGQARDHAGIGVACPDVPRVPQCWHNWGTINVVRILVERGVASPAKAWRGSSRQGVDGRGKAWDCGGRGGGSQRCRRSRSRKRLPRRRPARTPERRASRARRGQAPRPGAGCHGRKPARWSRPGSCGPAPRRRRVNSSRRSPSPDERRDRFGRSSDRAAAADHREIAAGDQPPDRPSANRQLLAGLSDCEQELGARGGVSHGWSPAPPRSGAVAIRCARRSRR